MDPIDHNYQDVSGQGMASKFIRARLSPELLLETNGIKPISVPKLLRKMRSYWNNGSTHDIDTLRTEFEEIPRYEGLSDRLPHQSEWMDTTLRVMSVQQTTIQEV